MPPTSRDAGSSGPAASRARRRRRLVLRYAGAVLAALFVLLSLARHARPGCRAPLPRVSALPAAAWLARAVSAVPCPTSGRVAYGIRDNLGAPVDALDPIDDPAGGYLGVYHSPLGSGRQASFSVSLGRSLDLLHWTRMRVLVPHGASMPTLRAIPGTPGYLLAYERSHAAYFGDTVALRWYPSRGALVAGRAGAQADLPLQLSRYNDGTPALLAVAWHGGPRRSSIDLSLHYQTASAGGGPGVDREAVGVVSGFRRFAVSPDDGVDAALDRAGLTGSHGDRRQFTFGGAGWRVYEAQSQPHSFASWHIVLDDLGTHRIRPLRIGVTGGPYATSFGNPIVSVLRAPDGRGRVLAVTMFVFGSGRAAADAGELVYDQPLR